MMETNMKMLMEKARLVPALDQIMIPINLETQGYTVEHSQVEVTTQPLLETKQDGEALTVEGFDQLVQDCEDIREGQPHSQQMPLKIQEFLTSFAMSWR